MTKNILLIIAALAIIWLLFRSCGERVVTKEDTHKLDSVVRDAKAVQARHERDSVAYQERINALQMALQERKDDRAILSGTIKVNERRIRELIAQVRGITDDSPRIAYQTPCDSLVDQTELLLQQNKELAEVNAGLEDNYGQQLVEQDTLIRKLRADYSAMKNNLDTCAQVASKLVNDLKRSGTQVYIGATGIYNPTTYGAGGAILIKTKKDKIYGASAYLTNSGMLYEGRVMIKISFRK